MKIYFEYYLNPEFRDLPSFLNKVLNEGYSDENFSSYNESSKKLLLDCKYNHSRIFKVEQHQSLNELALQIKYIWSQGKILNIFFLDGSEILHNKVLEIIKDWSDCCNLSFVKTLDRNNSDIRVSFDGFGYYSCIGTSALSIPRDKPTLNLQTNNGIDINGDEFKRLTLHEFGHALGLVHEHQRPDTQIEWNTMFVNNYFKTSYNWTDEMIKRNLYDVYDKNEVNSSDVVDPLSIMAYSVPKEFIKNGIVFNLNYNLSEIDKKHIGELYPKNKVDLIKG